jgi:hypothetical protein
MMEPSKLGKSLSLCTTYADLGYALLPQEPPGEEYLHSKALLRHNRVRLAIVSVNET